MRPPLILVVDDEPTLREALVELLSDEGFRVRAAPDGQQALDQVAAEPTDLIISDITMPNMDGPTMISRLRERGDAMPVILISAAYVALDLPGVVYIRKPFDIDHVVATVVGCLAETG